MEVDWPEDLADGDPFEAITHARATMRAFVEKHRKPDRLSSDASRSRRSARHDPREIGALADLVLFREDPTRDRAALDRLQAVVQDGRLYTREMLDAQQAAYRAHFGGFFRQRIATPILRAGLGVMIRRSGEASR